MSKILFRFLFVVVAIGAVQNAQAQIITTIAGTGVGGYSGDNHTAFAAKLKGPMQMATDQSGNLYIADQQNNRIRKIDPYGIITTVAGNGASEYNGDNIQATDAAIHFPSGIAVDNLGNLYIADCINNRIRKVTTDGIITTIAGTGVAGYDGNFVAATTTRVNNPNSIAVDDQGVIYFSDGLNSRVRKIDNNGIISTIAGTGQFGETNDNNSAVYAQINRPACVAVDNKGNVYLVEGYSNEIRKVDSKGIITRFAGTGAPGSSGDGEQAIYATLNDPTGMTFDKFGNIYIADNHSYEIRKIDTSGIISTIAGNSGSQKHSGDGGDGVAARLYGPTGVVTDRYGNIYVSESDNYIRYIYADQILENTSPMVIFPNPSDGFFNVELSSTHEEKATIVIYNVLGQRLREVYAATNSVLSIRLEEAGVYFLTGTSAHGKWKGKVSVAPDRW